MDGRLTPEFVSAGLDYSMPDDDLPLLAAHWLAEGWDSDELRELAAMSRDDARSNARRMLDAVLESLGFTLPTSTSPWEDLPWRGHWGTIAWARDVMDRLLSPYAAAQQVLEVVGDIPELWGPGRGEVLMALLAEWDASPGDRDRIAEELRSHVRSLSRDAVPPLTDPSLGSELGGDPGAPSP